MDGSMRVFGLDIGEKRVGVAVSDPAGAVATPLCVLATSDVLSNSAPFRRIMEDWEPELLICGLPKSLDGSEGPQASRIRQVADTISKSTGLSVVFVDERLSSREAKRILREEGYNEKSMRGKVDMIAASLFLQAYLDSQNPVHGS